MKNKKILILVGRGKSELTNWMESLLEDGCPWFYIIYGIEDLIKIMSEIKSDVEVGIKCVVHLNSEEDIKKIPLSIKRRALIFKIDF